MPTPIPPPQNRRRVRSLRHLGDRQFGVAARRRPVGGQPQLGGRQRRRATASAPSVGDADRAHIGDVHHHVEDRVGGAARGDRLGEQDREEQRRLPQVASFALPEQERGVAGRAGREQRRRQRQDLERGRHVDDARQPPQRRCTAANPPRIQAPRTSHDDVLGLVMRNQKRVGCLRSATSSTPVIAVNSAGDHGGDHADRGALAGVAHARRAARRRASCRRRSPSSRGRPTPSCPTSPGAPSCTSSGRDLLRGVVGHRRRDRRVAGRRVGPDHPVRPDHRPRRVERWPATAPR